MPKVKPEARVASWDERALIHREIEEDYWKAPYAVSPDVRHRLKEKALRIARKNGLPTLRKKLFEKGTFLTYPP